VSEVVFLGLLDALLLFLALEPLAFEEGIVGRGVLTYEQGPKGGAEGEGEGTTARADGGEGPGQGIEAIGVHAWRPFRPGAAVEAGCRSGRSPSSGGMLLR
jgi:hypothetical protein